MALAGVGPRDAPALPESVLPPTPPWPAVDAAVPAVATFALPALPEPPKPELVPAVACEPPCGSVMPEPALWLLQPAAKSRLKPSAKCGG